MGILIRGGRIVDAATDTDKTGDIYLEDGIITEMDMKVDDSRHDQLSFCINHTVSIFLFQLLPYFRDDPVFC